MTTIRISRLPEIKNDRVSADDYLIINDGDIVTSKVTFEEFVYAVGAQDIEFTGDVLYTGDVVFEGDVTGDFYNKDQSYSKAEIDQIVKNLNDYNIIQDARITAIETLIGRPTMSKDLGIFPGNIIPDNCTIVEAFESIEAYLIALEARVNNNELAIVDLRIDVDKLQIDVENIFIELNGQSGSNPNPNPPDPNNPDGVIEKVEWLIGQVEILWDHVTDIETVLGICDVTGLPGGSVTCALVNHEGRIETLRKLNAINDAENANLITLSGVSKAGGNVEGALIVSDNLEDFNYTPDVPDAVFNESLAYPTLNEETVKGAFQLVLTANRTKAPIVAPVFGAKTGSGVGSASSQSYSITGAKAASSMIPMYHVDFNKLNAWQHPQGLAGDAVNARQQCEGSFAYTKNDTGVAQPVGGAKNDTAAGRPWFRDQNEWIQLLATTNRSAIWEALGLKVATSDANASTHPDGPVPDGFIYVQKNNLTDSDATGWLKVNGVNTSDFPRV